MKKEDLKVGQKVVALCFHNNHSAEIKKGVAYTVSAITYCNKCGIQAISLGDPSKNPFSKCCCGNSYLNDGLSIFFSSRFAPLDNLSESIAEAVSNEDYELAELLTTIHTENFQLTELGL
jgi:hypothetical protein